MGRGTPPRPRAPKEYLASCPRDLRASRNISPCSNRPWFDHFSPTPPPRTGRPHAPIKGLMARAEFVELKAENENHDDEDNDPREDVLGRFVSQRQTEAVAAALPPGSRALAASGNIAQRVNSLVITAKANA